MPFPVVSLWNMPPTFLQIWSCLAGNGVVSLLENSPAVQPTQLPDEHHVLGSSTNTECCLMRSFTEIVTKKVQALKTKSGSKLPAKKGCKCYCMCNKCPNQWLFQPTQIFFCDSSR